MSVGTNSDGYPGQWDPTAGSSNHNATIFLIRMMMARMSTATLVKVQAVQGGGENPVGSVDVQPLVNLMDNANKSSAHGVLHKLPYLRLQGGQNAIILDPQVGDIGVALFADRDLSNVISSKKQANPGSRRRFDMADGMYLGGMLNGTPNQYVEFQAGGIKLLDKNGNQIVTSSNGIDITPATGKGITDEGTLDVKGAATLESTLDVKGATTLEASLTAAAAAFSGNVQLANGATVKRFFVSSISQTGAPLGANGSQILTFSVPGIQSGDFVVPQWTLINSQLTYAIANSGSGTLQVVVGNPTSVTQTVPCAANLLIIGTI